MFTQTCLWNLVNNLAGEIVKLNVNMDIVIKNVKFVELNTKIAKAVLSTQVLLMN